MIEAFFANPYGAMGALLLACFGAYLAWRNGHKTRLANASSSFRNAFATELSILHSDSKIDVHDLLLSAFAKHSEAVVVFRPYLSFLKRSGFDKAWHCYHSNHKTSGYADDAPFGEYIGLYHAEGAGVEAARSLAIKNINALLLFSRET